MSDILELTDSEFDDYLTVSLANYQRVTPAERKKLKGLMQHYAKSAHPFTQCVQDNTKRFGKDRAERVCAVLKDLIRGTTKWRGEERKKNFSENTLKELYELDVDESFYHYIEELSEEEIKELMSESDIDLSQQREQVLAELFFGADDAVEENGLLYKTIFREGTWKYSPGPGQKPVEKPLTVVKEGPSSRENLVISMAEIKDNFERGAKDSVTVPLNHDNKPHENTGYVRDLKFETDAEGRVVLKAGFEFTEPDVKGKAERGSIPGTSGGVVFDYIHKEKGDKFNAVLDHVALTPNPWLNGMEPFGMSDAENLTIIGFSEELEGTGGETEVTETVTEKTLAEKLGLSEDEILSRLNSYAELSRKEKERSVKEKINAWQADGKAPALLVEAEKVLMADSGVTSLNLSETESVSLSDLVERLVDSSHSVKLSEDHATDKGQTGEKPEHTTESENKEVELSQDEKVEVTSMRFDQGVPEAEAIKKVLAKRDSK